MTNPLTVEDIIEIIGGYRDPKTLKLKSLWDQKDPLLSLARYDVNIVESFCNQTTSGQGFTDKQADLARLLINKYTRQLTKHNVAVPADLIFRIPLRAINRQFKVWLDDSYIYLQFPYNKHLIEQVREVQKAAQGNVSWDKESKLWKLDLTEFNVNWAYAFALANKDFEIDSSVTKAMEYITLVEQTPYAIELTVKDGSLTISNAEDSLLDYVTANGGFTDENLLRLVDMAGTLSYTVNNVIKETVADVYGPRFLSLCLNRELKVDPGSDFKSQIKQIVDYATATNRLPIYVYEPDLSGKLLDLFTAYFNEEDICVIKSKDWPGLSPNTKLVYTHKIIRNHTGNIPLLVSGAGMMFGGDRQVWLQTAEKVVYFAKDIYNKSSKGREVCKLN